MNITSGVITGVAQKVVVYGPEGIGKSTFAAQFPDPVFIDTEGSTKHLDVKRMDRPSSWRMLLDQVAYIRNTPGICKTLIIDTGDWAEALCIEHICASAQKRGIEDFGYGKGYVYLAEEFGKLLNLLTDITERGINTVITAHAAMRKFEQPDEMGSYDRWELKLQKKTAPLVKEWADMVLFANYKTVVVDIEGKKKAQGGRRVMYTSHHPCWDAKNRHGLSDDLPFEYNAIAQIFQGAPPVQTQPAPAPTPAPTPQQVAPPREPAQNPEPPMRYWLKAHGEDPEEVIASVEPIEGFTEVDYATYKKVKDFYEANPPEWPADSDENPFADDPDITEIVDPIPGVPKDLSDLMIRDSATLDEVLEAVWLKYGEYYPRGTPITNFDPDFIKGVLIDAWNQVFDYIKTNVRGQKEAV